MSKPKPFTACSSSSSPVTVTEKNGGERETAGGPRSRPKLSTFRAAPRRHVALLPSASEASSCSGLVTAWSLLLLPLQAREGPPPPAATPLESGTAQARSKVRLARACRMPSRAYIKRLSMLLQSNSGCFDRRGGNGCERERGGVPMKMHLVTRRHQWRASHSAVSRPLPAFSLHCLPPEYI